MGNWTFPWTFPSSGRRKVRLRRLRLPGGLRPPGSPRLGLDQPERGPRHHREGTAAPKRGGGDGGPVLGGGIGRNMEKQYTELYWLVIWNILISRFWE